MQVWYSVESVESSANISIGVATRYHLKETTNLKIAYQVKQ